MKTFQPMTENEVLTPNQIQKKLRIDAFNSHLVRLDNLKGRTAARSIPFIYISRDEAHRLNRKYRDLKVSINALGNAVVIKF